MRDNVRTFRRRRLSMTSLIDIIFLLLLFFMLSSTFSKFAEVELLGAGAGPTSTDSNQSPLFLRLQIDGLNFNGTEQTLETLAETVIPHLDGPAPRTLLISLNEEITAQRLVDLLAVLRGLSGLSIQVLEAE